MDGQLRALTQSQCNSINPRSWLFPPFHMLLICFHSVHLFFGFNSILNNRKPVSLHICRDVPPAEMSLGLSGEEEDEERIRTCLSDRRFELFLSSGSLLPVSTSLGSLYRRLPPPGPSQRRTRPVTQQHNNSTHLEPFNPLTFHLPL